MLVFEVKVLFFVSIALMIWLLKGLPSARIYGKFGVLLSIIIISEVAFTLVTEGVLARPIGSGEINYDAALLVGSLVMISSLKSSNKWHVVLIVLAILLTLSRTASAIIAIFCLLYSRWSIGLRIPVLVVAIGAIIYSAASRGLGALDISQMDRFWMLVFFVDYLGDNLASNLVSLPIGGGMQGEIPAQLSWLWGAQAGLNNHSEVYPYQLHSFWLRFFASWGLLPGALLVLLFLWAWCRNNSLQMLLFIVSITVLGLTMSLFYLSNVGVVFWMIWFSIISHDAKHFYRQCAT